MRNKFVAVVFFTLAAAQLATAETSSQWLGDVTRTPGRVAAIRGEMEQRGVQGAGVPIAMPRSPIVTPPQPFPRRSVARLKSSAAQRSHPQTVVSNWKLPSGSKKEIHNHITAGREVGKPEDLKSPPLILNGEAGRLARSSDNAPEFKSEELPEIDAKLLVPPTMEHVHREISAAVKALDQKGEKLDTRLPDVSFGYSGSLPLLPERVIQSDEEYRFIFRSISCDSGSFKFGRGVYYAASTPPHGVYPAMQDGAAAYYQALAKAGILVGPTPLAPVTAMDLNFRIYYNTPNNPADKCESDGVALKDASGVAEPIEAPGFLGMTENQMTATYAAIWNFRYWPKTGRLTVVDPITRKSFTVFDALAFAKQLPSGRRATEALRTVQSLEDLPKEYETPSCAYADRSVTKAEQLGLLGSWVRVRKGLKADTPTLKKCIDKVKDDLESRFTEFMTNKVKVHRGLKVTDPMLGVLTHAYFTEDGVVVAVRADSRKEAKSGTYSIIPAEGTMVIPRELVEAKRIVIASKITRQVNMTFHMSRTKGCFGWCKKKTVSVPIEVVD